MEAVDQATALKEARDLADAIITEHGVSAKDTFMADAVPRFTGHATPKQLLQVWHEASDAAMPQGFDTKAHVPGHVKNTGVWSPARAAGQTDVPDMSV